MSLHNLSPNLLRSILSNAKSQIIEPNFNINKNTNSANYAQRQRIIQHKYYGLNTVVMTRNQRRNRSQLLKESRANIVKFLARNMQLEHVYLVRYVAFARQYTYIWSLLTNTQLINLARVVFEYSGNAALQYADTCREGIANLLTFTSQSYRNGIAKKPNRNYTGNFIRHPLHNGMEQLASKEGMGCSLLRASLRQLRYQNFPMAVSYINAVSPDAIRYPIDKMLPQKILLRVVYWVLKYCRNIYQIRVYNRLKQSGAVYTQNIQPWDAQDIVLIEHIKRLANNAYKRIKNGTMARNIEAERQRRLEDSVHRI